MAVRLLRVFDSADGKVQAEADRRVLAEIDKIRDLWKRPFIEFADDNAFVRRAWWRSFCPN